MKIGSKLKATVALILIALIALSVLLVVKQNKTYSVAFYDEEEKIFMSISYDATLHLPEKPEKKGYTFNGWFFDKDFEDALTQDSFKALIDNEKNPNYKGSLNYINSLLKNQKFTHNVYAKWIKGHTHELVRDYVIKEPTCEEEGLKVVKCKDETCDHTEQRIIPKVEYEFVKISKISPNCQTDGFKLYRCPHCEKTKEVAYRAEHNLITEIIEKATCEKDGKNKVYCLTEGCDEYKETISLRTGHNYIKNEELSIDPTCTTEGKLVENCNNEGCEHPQKEKNLPMIEHEFVLDKENSIAPNCDTDGLNIYICSVCGERKEVVVAKLGHNIITERVEPTCTTEGSIIKKCDREGCNHIDSKEVLPMTSHDLTGKWEYTDNRQILQKKCKNGDHYQYFNILDNEFINGYQIENGVITENNNPFIMTIEGGELIIKALNAEFKDSELVVINAYNMNLKIAKDAFIGTKLEKIIILNTAEIEVESGAIANSSIEIISLEGEVV